MPSFLSPEDLLMGADLTFDISIPPSILYAPGAGQDAPAAEALIVQLRPLSIGTFQLILKAARQDAGLIPLLMIKESLVQPALSLEQVRQLNLGLVSFLIDQIRQISGLTGKKTLSPT